MFNKIIKIQQSITPKNDKLGHFFWGFWYAIISYLISTIFNHDYLIFALPLVIGLYKELYDLISKKGDPELLDLIWTILPSIIMYILLLI